MSSKGIILGAFILVALAQLFIPAKMILDRESVLKKGKTFKFETTIVDPNDPFRGKYIALDFVGDIVEIPDKKNWSFNEDIYVAIMEDENGVARIKSLTKAIPEDEPYFLKAKVKLTFIPDHEGKNTNKLSIAYPFNRFYMEESKAFDAEEIFRKALKDKQKETYALVSIRNGEAVLKDVLISGVSIKELVKTKQKEEIQNQ